MTNALLDEMLISTHTYLQKKAKKREDKKVKKLQKQLKTAKKIEQLLTDNPEMVQLALAGSKKSKKKM